MLNFSYLKLRIFSVGWNCERKFIFYKIINWVCIYPTRKQKIYVR